MKAFVDILRLATESLWERKTRSLLTTLMVATGCSLMIALKGMTAGFSNFIDVQFAKLAPNILFVTSARDSNNGEYFANSTPANKAILNEVVARKILAMQRVSEVIPAFQGLITLESRGRKVEATVFSIDPSKLKVIAPTLKLTSGSVVRPSDTTALLLPQRIAEPPGSAPFAVAGQTVRATYTYVSAETGKQVDNTRSFVVSGVIQDTGEPNIDNGVIINPTVSNAFLQKGGRYDGLMVAAQSADAVPIVEEQIRTMYGKQVGISTPRSILQTLTEFIDAFGSFTESTSIVALMVGAVGIITTLYTSVTERTREIGTLKALGARNRFVLTMFLAEAAVIGVVGATLGIGLGMIGGYVLIARFASSRPDLVPVYLAKDMLAVWVLTIGLSLLAGLYPAWRAARITPMMALRRD